MLVPFHDLTDDQLARVIAIYEEALAAAWEWPPERLREIARDSEPSAWALAALEDGVPAGFIILDHLPRGRMWYIRYFAVRADLRGQGWGSRILEAALTAVEDVTVRAGRGSDRGTLLEAEAIEGGLSDPERALRLRRQAFYRRHGAVVTGALTPRWPDAPAAMPDFDLLFIPGRAWDGTIDGRFCRGIVRSLMVEGYGVPEDAAWLVAALDRYGA